MKILFEFTLADANAGIGKNFADIAGPAIRAHTENSAEKKISAEYGGLVAIEIVDGFAAAALVRFINDISCSSVAVCISSTMAAICKCSGVI